MESRCGAERAGRRTNYSSIKFDGHAANHATQFLQLLAFRTSCLTLKLGNSLVNRG